MGFFKKIGKGLDDFFEVSGYITEELAKTTSKMAKKSVTKADLFLDDSCEIASEIFDEFDRQSNKINKTIKKGTKELLKDAAGVVEATDYLATQAISSAKQVIIIVVKQIVDLVFIQNEVKEKCPSALRAKILAKKKNAVDVGIFSHQGRISNKITIQSDCGISDDIYSGQIIIF